MAESAIKRIAGEVTLLESLADQAMENLSKPLHIQFAMLAKGKTIDEGRDAANKFLAWLDDVEKQNAP